VATYNLSLSPGILLRSKIAAVIKIDNVLTPLPSIHSQLYNPDRAVPTGTLFTLVKTKKIIANKKVKSKQSEIVVINATVFSVENKLLIFEIPEIYFNKYWAIEVPRRSIS